MTIKLTWLGHGSWAVQAGTHTLLVDPFLNDSPTAPYKADRAEAEFILVSHGHFDHVADVGEIANRCGSTVVANYEVATWLEKNHRVKSTQPMNLGGGIDLPFGRVVLTPAWHSSQLPDGSDGGNPGGFVISAAGKRIYFACDTGLFSDMKLFAHRCDAAVLPIGDRFTMGPDDALRAVQLIDPQKVLPSHFNTWPPIAQDAAAWAKRVREETSAEPVVLEPGQSCEV